MSLQVEFAAALLDPACPCPADLKTWNDSDPAARLAVYRNNVTTSLVDALATTFPVVQQLVGETFFRAMARLFVRRAPPSSPILALYGAEFPAFIAGFAPAADLPWLADVARLEYLRLHASHAADAPAVDAAELAALLGDPERLGELRLVLQPALALLRSPFAVVSLWAAHQGVLELARVDPSRAENALVLRHELEVEVIGLAPAEALFVARLQQGASLGQAAGEAAAEHPGLDIAPPLAQLIRAGAICRFGFANGGHCA